MKGERNKPFITLHCITLPTMDYFHFISFRVKARLDWIANWGRESCCQPVLSSSEFRECLQLQSNSLRTRTEQNRTNAILTNERTTVCCYNIMTLLWEKEEWRNVIGEKRPPAKHSYEGHHVSHHFIPSSRTLPHGNPNQYNNAPTPDSILFNSRNTHIIIAFPATK